MATAGSIVIDLLMRTGAFETDTKRAEKRLAEMAKVAKQAGVALGAALAAGATAAAVAIGNAINEADKLDELSAKLGISTEKLSEWGYAAKLSGTDLDGLSRAIPKLSKTLADAADASSSAGKLFKGLGIDVKDAQGNLRDVEDVLPEIADRFKALNNDTLETALAMQIFGKSGADLLEFLNRGGDGLDALGAKARALGIVIDGDTAAAAAKFKDELDSLKAASNGLFTQIAAQLLPTLTDTVTKFSALVSNGQLAGNAVTVFSAALKAGVGILQVYNLAVDTLSARIEQLVRVSAGLAMAQANITTFGLAEGSVVGGLKGAARGFAAGEAGVGAAFQRFGAPAQGVQVLGSTSKAGTGQFANVNMPAGAAEAAALEKRLNALLASGGGSGKAKGAGGGKSDAERAAEQLASAYASLNGSLAEQIALFGKVGEAAKVRYDVEFGSLKGLTQTQKDGLIAQAERLDAMEAEAEVAERLKDANDRLAESVASMLDDIAFEAELLGKTAEEQDLLNRLRYAGVDANSAYGESIRQATEELQRQRQIVDDQVEAMDGLRDSARGFLEDLGDGVGVWNSLKSAADSFAETITRMVQNRLIEQLFGQQGSSGAGTAGGDFFGSILGSLFGGGRAGGGDAFPGSAFLVGENGPEMFVPRTAGTVLPAAKTAAAMGAGGGRGFQQVNHFHYQAPYDARTEEHKNARLAFETQRAMARNR